MNTIQDNTIIDNKKEERPIFHIISQYKKLMAEYDLLKLSNYEGITDVKIDTIPVEKSHFLGSNDMWKSLDLPEELNITGCIYYANSKSSFPVHKHEEREETIVILQGGGVKYILENGKRGELHMGESLTIPRAVGHHISWESDTVFLALWSPRFENNTWSAKFIDN